MDPFKVGNYSDSLEKGNSESHPLHLEAHHACPVQLAQAHRRRSFFKHVCLVFGTAVLTYLAFSYGKRLSSRSHDGWHRVSDRVGLSPSADEYPNQCTGGTNWTTYYGQPPWALEHPYGAEITFSLPLDSDAFYLVSRGVFQHGQVNIEQSTQVGDTVGVHVRVAYYDDEALERAAVCHMETEEREHGVGIFTPRRARRHYDPKDELLFDVTLTLPSGNGGPLSVKELKTKMPSYSQNVADLRQSVLFDEISLRSSVGRLIVQSVTSEVGQFSTQTGEIGGHFDARSSLDFHTSTGPITATVNLLRHEGMNHSNLTIRTTTGHIDTEVSLTSEAPTDGEFRVDAATTVGNIGLNFTYTPVDSVLRCHAESSLGGIKVELDSAFDGSYSLQSVLGKMLVSQHDVEDPAEKGRHRVVSQHEASRRVEGEVRWVEGDGSGSGSDGYVALKATVGSVELIV